VSVSALALFVLAVVLVANAVALLPAHRAAQTGTGTQLHRS
jgi:hypothetical protein